MKYAVSIAILFCCLLGSQAAWANMPIDEYASHRTVRMLDDMVASLCEHSCSMIMDCEEVEDYLWCDTCYTGPMMAAGAAGWSWEHFQEAFVWQEHLNVMYGTVEEINILCDDLLAEPPDNWQISPMALSKAAEIRAHVPALTLYLDEIQFWLDQSFPHRDHQQMWVQAENIWCTAEELECLVRELAHMTCTNL